MRATPPRRRVPEVNLLSRQRRPGGPGGPPITSTRRLLEMALIVFVVVIWAGVGAGMALLLGWHPQLDLGP